MATARKRLVVFVVAVGFWFLAADAYWNSKVRAVEHCTLYNATELVKARAGALSFSNWDHDRSFFYQAKKIVYWFCRWKEGGGYEWDSVRGMAYWEIILLAPIAYRFRFE